MFFVRRFSHRIPLRLHLACKRAALLSLCLTLAACSPVEQPYSDAHKAPSMDQSYFYPGDADTALPLRYWGSKARSPQAVIVALHGFNDYSRAFEPFGEYATQHNIALYAYDQRGFGGNDNAGIWGNVRNLTRDAGAAVEAVKARHPNVPVYLMGESMGGAIAVATLAGEYAPKVQGVILSAPALWGADTMSFFYRAALWAMVHTFPEKKLTGEELDIFPTDNIDILRQMGMDPKVIKASRVDAMYGIVQLMDKAQSQIGMLKTPVLMLYGKQDQVIPPLPIARGITKLNAPYTMAYYPDGFHLLLRDKQRMAVYGDIVSWIESPYRPLPSGFDMGWRSALDPYFLASE